MANAGQRLEVDMLDSVVPITGDRVRLTQVIDNVLSNAIKFTPEGGEIRLGLRTSDQLATISITDSGIGFNPGFEHEMFEPFIQAPQSIGRSASGLGLGLAISRKLVELHGGTLSATSSGPGSGSEFIIQLPVSGAQKPHIADGSPHADAAGLRVLLVEDNRVVAESMRELLERVGHQVDVAFDGPSALRMARNVNPDLILCDLGLPAGMTGFDVARACREDDPIRTVRIIAVSGYGGDGKHRDGQTSDFDEMVVKPLSLAKLRQLTRRS